MVVITQRRFEGQDGKPTHPILKKKMSEGIELKDIPHRYYFPKDVLKNLLRVKKSVLRNKEAYIRSGGGNKMTSAVIIVAGKSNSGKSTLASQLALFFDPKMTMKKNYAWNMKRLMQLANNTYPGMVILMDEAMIINSRSANSGDNLKIIIALSQIRSKGVFFLFCINSVHQLEKTIPLTRADFLIRIKRVGGIDGIPKYCIYDENKMKELIIKNSGKYSYAGVYPNISWTTFSKYFPFDDVRYDKLKHLESKKNLDGKEKVFKKERMYKLGLTRLIEYCRMNGLIRTYEDFHKITNISSISLAGYKNTFYNELEKVDFEKLSELIEGKKRKLEEKKYCKCGEVLGAKNRTGLCGSCYANSVRKDDSQSSKQKAKLEKEKRELIELRKMKKKYDRYLELRNKRKEKRLEKEKKKNEQNNNLSSN